MATTVDDFDLVAGGRPFLSLAVVCFGRAADFDLAIDRLLFVAVLLFWRVFVCRPVAFVGGEFISNSSGISGGATK